MAGARKSNWKKYKKYLPVLLVLALLVVLIWYLSRTSIPVLEPAGQIGAQERDLMKVAILLSVIVVVPVFAMTIFIVTRYRENGSKARRYNPDWDHSRLYETLWWGIPGLIITILSVVAWRSSHQLDPYKALAATSKPLTVQVVALDWKWLFIYPAQNMASVNLADVPVNTPVDFEITSDTVMNSFWVPQLGGQIYAMPGMETQLHLVANKTGSFYGSSANISGTGFASMNFKINSVNGTDFSRWVSSVQKSQAKLSQANYDKLAKPTAGYPVTYYSSVKNDMFFSLINKYMIPPGGDTQMVMPMHGGYMQ